MKGTHSSFKDLFYFQPKYSTDKAGYDILFQKLYKSSFISGFSINKGGKLPALGKKYLSEDSQYFADQCFCICCTNGKVYQVENRKKSVTEQN